MPVKCQYSSLIIGPPISTISVFRYHLWTILIIPKGGSCTHKHADSCSRLHTDTGVGRLVHVHTRSGSARPHTQAHVYAHRPQPTLHSRLPSPLFLPDIQSCVLTPSPPFSSSDPVPGGISFFPLDFALSGLILEQTSTSSFDTRAWGTWKTSQQRMPLSLSRPSSPSKAETRSSFRARLKASQPFRSEKIATSHPKF